jgi:glycine/D-amino acid oxidase-like deaminating enzyme/nitrite reductase/ring-hydroxylating ferredoxin subunit
VKTESYWEATQRLSDFPQLERDIEVDVVVVGAGLTGITTAYLLRQEGVRVALIERDRIAAGDTSRTTAHLTYVTDYRLHEIAKKFGKDAAKSFWEGGAAAIDQIESITRQTNADCGFHWAPGYLHESITERDPKERERLQEDAELAREFGFDARFVETVPYAKVPGVRFAHQAKFHPLKYLDPLVRAIPGNGSYVFEKTEFEEVEDKPMVVHANGKKIRCQYLVIATHNPLMGKKGLITATLFQSKLALYTSYVLGARLPKDALPEALFWDTSEPYYYLRVDPHEDHQYAIFGGEDVKTGQEEDRIEVFKRLEQKLLAMLPMAKVEHRWMGQVVETDDGLPFIGENANKEFVATGFCGNGFTLGTLSAMMARDRYMGRNNPWFDLFRVDRRPFHGGVWRYVKENLDYPYYLLRDRFSRAETDTLADLKNGEGKIVKLQGKKLAAYRNDEGKVTLCSPVCTHLKCIVRWNEADKTWDCPCHGSRFHATGEVLGGPAEEPLEKVNVSKLK